MADPGGVLPFWQFVLKVHSRCDLACDHCYVYEHADQNWRGRPTVISPQTVARAVERIAEQAIEHRWREVRVILHGGEPLLAGGSSGTDSLPQMRSCLPESPRQGTGMGGGNPNLYATARAKACPALAGMSSASENPGLDIRESVGRRNA